MFHINKTPKRLPSIVFQHFFKYHQMVINGLNISDANAITEKQSNNLKINHGKLSKYLAIDSEGNNGVIKFNIPNLVNYDLSITDLEENIHKGSLDCAVGEVLTANILKKFILTNKGLNQKLHIPNYSIVTFINSKEKLAFGVFSSLVNGFVNCNPTKMQKKMNISCNEIGKIIPLQIVLDDHDHPGPGYTNVITEYPTGRLTFIDFDASLIPMNMKFSLAQSIDKMRSIYDTSLYTELQVDFRHGITLGRLIEEQKCNGIIEFKPYINSKILSYLYFLKNITIDNIKNADWESMENISISVIQQFREEFFQELEKYPQSAMILSYEKIDQGLKTVQSQILRRIDEGKEISKKLLEIYPNNTKNAPMPSAVLLNQINIKDEDEIVKVAYSSQNLITTSPNHIQEQKKVYIKDNKSANNKNHEFLKTILYNNKKVIELPKFQ